MNVNNMQQVIDQKGFLYHHLTNSVVWKSVPGQGQDQDRTIKSYPFFLHDIFPVGLLAVSLYLKILAGK
jgi:hypothetical protein